MRSIEYYSDKESTKMTKRRKHELILRYSLFGALSSIYTILFLGYVVFTSSDPLQTRFVATVLFALSLPLFYWALYYVMVRSEKAALKRGVVLTDDCLLVREIEISLNLILKAEVADFGAGKQFLAIGYLRERGGRKKPMTELMWPTDTKDIWELCNKIRDLKGWPKQSSVQIYGWQGWSKWKRQLKDLAETV